MADSVPSPFLPPGDESYGRLRCARGSFDDTGFLSQGEFAIAGWLLLPDVELHSFLAYLNGELAGAGKIAVRPDVTEFFAGDPHARKVGFDSRINRERVRPGLNRLDVVAYDAGGPVARLDTLWRGDLDDVVPTPPPFLMERVAGHRDMKVFKQEGLRCYGDFRGAMDRHGGRRPGRRLLDLGCACGRVTAHFLNEADGLEVFGCDTDPDAVVWCRRYLPRGQFAAVARWPPLPYAEASLDVVVGYSVFTHFARPAQAAWLAELRRVVVPNGLVLATVQGALAAASAPPEIREPMRREGIADDLPDSAQALTLKGEYYRSVFQTREHTVRAWSEHFEILEYVEGGANGCQDLIVMRRRA